MARARKVEPADEPADAGKSAEEREHDEAILAAANAVTAAANAIVVVALS